MKSINGLRKETPKHLLLDSGAFFKNYDLLKSYEQNKANLIGATQGGGSFSAVPNARNTEIDGVRGPVKGMQQIDYWDVKMTSNVKEVTAENMQIALGAADIEEIEAPEGYQKIIPKEIIEDKHYLDNLTWVGTLKGAPEKPVIIMVKNAISMNGLSLTVKDKDEAVIPITVQATYDPDESNTVPFAIYYPKMN